MKPGDLVKIYNFTHKARKHFAPGGDDSVNDHYVGLITKGDGSPEYGDYRQVLRSVDGVLEFYSVHRLEVINASR
jgi:hypothetical protein|tara:strand:- start:253 stop:477 length:225 start_codon:yes stop_codon:yes gene_type:complete